MKSVRERVDINAVYREVGSYRGAAAICGTTHKTVKRVVLAAEAATSGPAVVEHNYDAVRDVVAVRVAKTHGRISAKRLLPAAVSAGYAGSARNFRRLVAAEKAAWRKGLPRVRLTRGVDCLVRPRERRLRVSHTRLG
jgi:hypothetical protein